MNVVVGSDAVRRRRIPYGQPVDGLERTVDAITLDDVRAFHAAHYRPSNASLVVAGDFDEATLPARAGGALGGVEAGPAAAARRAAPPWPARAAPGASSIARARPRASCAWSRPAPIVFRPTGPGCRC